MWLHHALQVPEEMGSGHRGGQCEQLRAGGAQGCQRSQARRCLHVDMEILEMSVKTHGLSHIALLVAAPGSFALLLPLPIRGTRVFPRRIDDSGPESRAV